jgi:hypothetical protein
MVLRYRWFLVGAALILGVLTGFTTGVLCEARAEATTMVRGGSVREQAAAIEVLQARPDFAEVVRLVTFVPQEHLIANLYRHPFCYTNPDGTPRSRGRCTGEAVEGRASVRIATGLDDWVLRFTLTHEYAHVLMEAICGICTRNEALVQACADDASQCWRNQWW